MKKSNLLNAGLVLSLGWTFGLSCRRGDVARGITRSAVVEHQRGNANRNFNDVSPHFENSIKPAPENTVRHNKKLYVLEYNDKKEIIDARPTLARDPDRKIPEADKKTGAAIDKIMEEWRKDAAKNGLIVGDFKSENKNNKVAQDPAP